jgi:two-component system, LytTR family, response regulator
MNKIKTVLIDDEQRGLTALQKLLELNCPKVDIIACCNNAEEAKQKIGQLSPQLVFIDIAMPGKTGFDLLRELPEINFEIIFVTAHSSYVVQAFHFSAVDYLLKPVDDELLAEAVKRAGKKIEEKADSRQIETFLHNMQYKSGSQKMKLCIQSQKGFQVIEIQDIIYCEANTNYTNFHFTSRPTICASKTIHDYEELLEDCGFVRIHKSFLVNLGHIKEYIRGERDTVVLSNDVEVEVSRRKKEFFVGKMKEFYKF